MVKKAALILIFALLVNVIGLLPVSADAVTGDNGVLKWYMPPQGTSAGESSPHAYDIRALKGASEKSTTFGNGGYYARLLSQTLTGSATAYNLDRMSYNTEKYLTSSGTIVDTKPDGVNSLGLKVRPFFLASQPQAVFVTFTVTNYSPAAQTFSLGSGSDVQVGGNDRATVKILDGKIGFTMVEDDRVESSLRYVFLGKHTDAFPQITDVEKIWVGGWGGQFYNSYAFSDQRNDLSGADSAMAFSWTNRVIGPGEEMEFTVVFMLGAANEITLPGDLEKPVASPAPGTYSSGQSVTLSSTTEGAAIYYTLDGTTPTTSSILYTGTPIEVDESATIKAIAVTATQTSAIAVLDYVISLPPPTFTVRGILRQESLTGSPVPGASVTLKQGSTVIAGPVTSADDGTFELAEILDGVYTVVVEKDLSRTTTAVTVSGADASLDIVVPSTNTVIEREDENIPDVAAEGLNELFGDPLAFTPDDQDQLNAGNNVEFRLVLGSSTPSPDIGQSVAAQLGEGEQVGTYLDASLFKVVTDSLGNNLDSSPVHALSSAIRLIIPIPEDLQGKGPYKVIRVHEDPETGDISSEILEDMDGDDNDNSITIETDRFSVYAVVHTVRAVPSSEDDDSDTDGIDWQEVRDTIQAANEGEAVDITVPQDVLVPATVFSTLLGKENVALIIRFADGTTVTIPSGAVQAPPPGRVAYSAALLLELYGNTAAAANMAPNPNTGRADGGSIIGLLLVAAVCVYGFASKKK